MPAPSPVWDRHVQPDDGAVGVRVQFDPVAYLVDEPQAVAPGGVGRRRLGAGQRVGDHPGVAQLADDLPVLLPDVLPARPYTDPAWEPLWEAAEGLGVPLATPVTPEPELVFTLTPVTIVWMSTACI